MARRRKGDAVSGWICLDKAYDLTSTHAVSRVRRAFNAQKAGHAGTHDPLATGILPIALGEATKTVPYLVEADKACKSTGMPDQLISERVYLAIAGRAARAGL